MGLLDAILGRTKAKPPDLDRLFALPAAAVTVEAELGLRPAGAAAVALKPASGRSFVEAFAELNELVALAAAEAKSAIDCSWRAMAAPWCASRLRVREQAPRARAGDFRLLAHEEPELGGGAGPAARARRPVAVGVDRGARRARLPPGDDRPPVGVAAQGGRPAHADPAPARPRSRQGGPPRDEYGETVPDNAHAALFAESMRLLGLDPTAGPDLERLPAVALTTSTFVNLLGRTRRLVAAPG